MGENKMQAFTSFISKGFNWIGLCSLYTLKANNKHGDEQGYKTCQGKSRPALVCSA
jgi:hypothetical protein